MVVELEEDAEEPSMHARPTAKWDWVEVPPRPRARHSQGRRLHARASRAERSSIVGQDRTGTQGAKSGHEVDEVCALEGVVQEVVRQINYRYWLGKLIGRIKYWAYFMGRVPTWMKEMDGYDALKF